MGVGQGESGTNGERCSEVADRLVEIPLAREGPSKVVLRLDVARIDAHRFSSVLDRFRLSAQPSQGQSEGIIKASLAKVDAH